MKLQILIRLAALACVPAVSALAADHEVTVGGSAMRFAPSDLTIRVGDTVTFVNAGGTHNVVADDGSFRCAAGCSTGGANRVAVGWYTMLKAQGAEPDGYCGPYGGYGCGGDSPGDPSPAAWRTTLTFGAPGTVGYHCESHGRPGSGMFGRIVVEAPAGGTFHIGPSITGNWYDPSQNGHGVQLEVIGETLVTAIWFTFDANGAPVWIVGSGTIDGDRIVMQAGRSSGGRFPPNFDPAAVVAQPWGTLTFTFGGCASGRMDWTSTDPAFTASGTLPLVRLTQVQGMDCP